MKKVISIKNKPVFFPSISNDKDTWFWKSGIKTDGLLLSYDVLMDNPLFQKSNKTVNTLLDFKGFVIIDSGAFGHSTEKDPFVIYARQKNLKPAISILLDQIPEWSDTLTEQRKAITVTVQNAKLIKKKNRGKITLMAVVQGNDDKLLHFCCKKIKAIGFGVVGIPLSRFSKHKQYLKAIERVNIVKKYFGPNVILHGLGCGSRTMIALLTHMGLNFFDSSSFYKSAALGKAFETESFCSINKPNSKPECKSCLRKNKAPESFKKMANYNLREILKEIQRCQCAKSENRMKEYLVSKRLKKTTLAKVGHLL